MERRDFLQMMALAAPALTVSGRLFAAPPGSPRFLLVFLRGGYDCANVVIPYSSSYYYESRPNIAVAKPTAGGGAAGASGSVAADTAGALGPDTAGALALDSDWALTPALRSSIAPLYTRRQALFIPFAGTD